MLTNYLPKKASTLHTFLVNDQLNPQYCVHSNDCHKNYVTVTKICL